MHRSTNRMFHRFIALTLTLFMMSAAFLAQAATRTVTLEVHTHDGVVLIQVAQRGETAWLGSVRIALVDETPPAEAPEHEALPDALQDADKNKVILEDGAPF